MSQKNKLTSAVKVTTIQRGVKKGAITLYALKNCYACEKTMAGVFTSFTRYTKKLGITWIGPIQIKTTTKKGEKRLGKGKGAVVTYNRCVPIKAGQVLFELGYINQLSSRKIIQTKRMLHSLIKKIPTPVRVEFSQSAPALIYPNQPIIFSPYK